MNFDHRPITELLRGPVLHTPQGWVVLATGALYARLALLTHTIGTSPSLGKTSSEIVVVCAFWPLIPFLMFVRTSGPEFRPSVATATYLAAAAVAPFVYAGWRLHGA
ncbi:hypothetical protein [Hydrogenophaga sp.]|uniref:hypothetical protein n=1 Tax=Hydrogenophaga sp. TaxID=1904254 RepID=UPI00286DF6CE|nr:hypothetical protein [Hydrogenophaga sp.]